MSSLNCYSHFLSGYCLSRWPRRLDYFTFFRTLWAVFQKAKCWKSILKSKLVTKKCNRKLSRSFSQEFYFPCVIILSNATSTCCMRDELDSQAGVEKAVWTRVTAARKRWWEMNHSIGLGTRLELSWNLLYCMEKKHGHWQADWWMFYICKCDHRMLRYMAGVTWQDRRSSSEVEELCGVQNICQVEAEKTEMVWTCEKSRRGRVGLVRVGGNSCWECLGKSGVSVWWRKWTYWEWRSVLCRIDGYEKQSSHIQPHPRRKMKMMMMVIMMMIMMNSIQ
mgnify:CR=1 FL=1